MVELLKPVTWFPPMWAFGCGVASAGVSMDGRWLFVAAGVLLAGPLVCGASQIVNDWFDRHVDAINEPKRPIPSGRVPGRVGLYYAIFWTVLCLAVGAALGRWVLAATVVGLILAWAYSAPPARLKRNGWLGPLAVGFSYEGLAWFTGAAVIAGGLPDHRSTLLAALYSLGAFGIMTLNDFKAVEGDRKMGLRSLPVQLGEERAGQIACVVMAIPQAAVIALLFSWGRPIFAAAITTSLLIQGALMVWLLQKPKERTPGFNTTGTTLYVLGMLVSAFAVGGLIEAGQ